MSKNDDGGEYYQAGEVQSDKEDNEKFGERVLFKQELKPKAKENENI